MREIDHPHIKQGAFGVDFLAMDLHARIDAGIFESVIASANILQERHFVMFEKRDIVYYSVDQKLWMVTGVLDNRHRDAIRAIRLECCNRNGDMFYMNANYALHLGYIIEAAMGFQWQVVDPTENSAEFHEKLLQVIQERLNGNSTSS